MARRRGGRLVVGRAGPLLDLLVDVRRELRQVQQWALADQIRDRLAEQGILLEDGKDGTRWVIT